ncbi:iron import ATP-binding/permease protein IrtA [Acrocarpospora pleiomorpha]|uniref:Mycobactin import ATP-binding/permease protein IrtA n=1 Tax=Acrocarpospora pleiomorpha TaxID=90975 RepID=A0A5M3XGN5_9ACTN|nr:ABC transporter ATP-binding protein/permease [Acrocarpospora pleiomorpha]GES18771.1 iron import ATP-binding/permease protein IrtA [Acrocarpospora pleiomorpha]
MAKRGFQGAVMRGFGARDHEATVVGKQWLAPHFVRVRLTSPTLFKDVVVEPTAWLRFWFPDPDGGAAEHQRAYTISEADETTGAFAVDVVLHEPAGPASVWARAAEPGWTVMVTSLGSSKFEVPPEPPAGYLLIGDSASIPAINGILAVVPGDVPVEVYLERHDEADLLIPLAAHPRARTHWVPKRGPASLAAALEGRDWSDWKAWAAAESGSLKQVRGRLREEFGFPKSELYAQAYWFHGRAMGTLRAASAPDQVTAEAATPPETTVPVAPSSSPADGAAAASPVRGAWRAQAAGRLLAPLRRTLILAAVLQAVVTLVQLAPFVLLVELARRMLAGQAASALWTVGFWALGLLGAGTVLSGALTLWLHIVDARFARGLRQRLLGKAARLPLGWFTARGSGHVKQVVQDDTLALHYLVTHAVPDAVAAVVAPLAVLAYLFVVDWRVALALFGPVLVYAFTAWVMIMQSGAKISQAQRWAERMDGEAGAYLEGQPVIRVFGGAAASTFRARLEEYIRFLNDWQRPFTSKKTLMDLATRPATFLLVIAIVGTVLIASGSMRPVTLLPFLLLGTTFGARLLGIAYGLGGLRAGLLAARRVQNTLDEPELQARSGEAVTGAKPPGTVVFDRVGFAYRPGVPVIHDVSLTLTPGTVTALVGPSGSGKSTLAALLARFHDVDSGAIRVGGRDIRDLTADELYEQVGFVFQQTQLVHGTAHDNIALAVPGATREQVMAAAREAHIHDRIMRLPDGYDTMLGPDAALSGGERQRLTIARAILADTPVLVLDEATAFADPESEYLLQQALDRLTADRTVLVIAHRLHTITGVDRIVVLDAGHVAETGAHDELLAARGRYRRLWDAGQGRAVEPEEATR